MVRLSDLVRKLGESAPPVQDSAPPQGGPHQGPGLAGAESAGGPAALIQAGGTEGPAIQDLDAANQVMQRAVDIVEKIFHAVRTHAPFSVSNAEETVEVLLQGLNAGDALLIPFFNAGGPSPSPGREAVNVCLLSLKMGLELGYAPEELRKLGLAGLLCDVGMARVPPQILGKQDGLTPDERALIETHQREGAKLLQELGGRYSWLAEVVGKRHAKIEGPRQPENALEEYAAIIHLVDIYESLVHHRPFRHRIGTLEALKKVLRDQRATFPDRILKALIRALSTFPAGSLIRLNTGEIGRVVAKNKDFPLRPVVEILVRRGKRLEEPVVIDLSQSPLHHIQDSFVEEPLDEVVL